MNTATKPRKRMSSGPRKIKARAKTGTYQDSIYPTAEERKVMFQGAQVNGSSYSGFVVRAAVAEAERVIAAKAKLKAKASK